MLLSAVGYVMQAGLLVNAGNVDGNLVITVAGAAMDYNNDVARFVPALSESALAESTTTNLPAQLGEASAPVPTGESN